MRDFSQAVSEARQSAKDGYQAIAVVYKDDSISDLTYDADDKEGAQLDWDSFTNDPSVTVVGAVWYVPTNGARAYRLKASVSTEHTTLPL